MNVVVRKDGRHCRVVPAGTSYDSLHDILPDGKNSQPYKGDDAVMYMPFYSKGGAVATFCGQFALYDNQKEGEPDCIACLARVGLRPARTR